MIALSVCAHIWSHDSDKAFFTIDFNSSSEHIVVYCDLPFELRMAMFQDLDQDSLTYISHYGKNSFEYGEIQDLYLQKNIFFLKANGDTLQAKLIRALPKEEERSGSKFEMIFLDREVAVFHNSLFFNFDQEHQNQHKILYQDQKDAFTTSLKNPTYKMELFENPDKAKSSNKFGSSEMTFWLLLGMIPILLILYLMFRKKF